MIRVHGRRYWSIVADGSHGKPVDVSGSEAYCNAELTRRSRHYPQDEFRVMTLAESQREVRRKTWSVNDDDHIADGEHVLLMATPAQLHPSITQVRTVFGMSHDDGAESRRTGVVKHRNRRTGDYMVRIDGSGLSVCVSRADLIYPVPDNIIPLENRAAKR